MAPRADPAECRERMVDNVSLWDDSEPSNPVRGALDPCLAAKLLRYTSRYA